MKNEKAIKYYEEFTVEGDMILEVRVNIGDDTWCQKEKIPGNMPIESLQYVRKDIARKVGHKVSQLIEAQMPGRF